MKMYNQREVLKKARELKKPTLASFYIRRLNQGYLKRYLERVNWINKNDNGETKK